MSASEMSDKIVPLKSKINSVRELLERSKNQLAMALPTHMNADRMLRVAMTSIQRTPELLNCDQRSLLGAIMQAAQLGLEPDGVLGHAYLVPFKGRVQFIPGYKGLIDLARRSGNVESLQARVVFDGDEFSFGYGDTPFITHNPVEPAEDAQMKAVYAVAKLKGGETVFEVMWRSQIEAIRKRSPAGQRGPWVTDYEEMARKTVVRRLCKYLPLSVELHQAVALDELAERGISQDLDVIDVPGEVEADEPEQTAGLDAVAEKIEQGETPVGRKRKAGSSDILFDEQQEQS